VELMAACQFGTFVHDIHLVINSTHEFLFCVSFNVFVCGVFSGISLNMLFILGSAHNHLAHILSLKIQVMYVHGFYAKSFPPKLPIIFKFLSYFFKPRIACTSSKLEKCFFPHSCTTY